MAKTKPERVRETKWRAMIKLRSAVRSKAWRIFGEMNMRDLELRPSDIITRLTTNGKYVASFWHYAAGWQSEAGDTERQAIERARRTRARLDGNYPRITSDLER